MKLNTFLTAVVIICITLASCKKSIEPIKTPIVQTTIEAAKGIVPTEIPSKETITENTEDLIDENGDPIIIGKQKRATLEKEPYKKWFDENYKQHSLDTLTMRAIKDDLAQTDITLFMGTWCEDSQREIPAFFKALDIVGINSSHVNIITLSEDKESPAIFLEGRDVNYVPTIIFKKEGKELGRIVEYSIFSIEKDMAKILNGEGYKHPYAE